MSINMLYGFKLQESSIEVLANYYVEDLSY